MTLTLSYFPARREETALATTTHGVLVERAKRTPQAVALLEAGADDVTRRTWSYADLRDDSARLALALLSRYESGDRIAVWAPNSPQWLILQFAAAFAGLTLVAIDPICSARELNCVLRQSRALGLFRAPMFRGASTTKIAAEAIADLRALREVVDLTDTERLYAKARCVDGLPEVRPDDTAQIRFVRRAGGAPKGFAFDHGDLTNSARVALSVFRMDPGDILLDLTPTPHATGCPALNLGAVQLGARMIADGSLGVGQALDLIQAERVTFLFAAPAMIAAMIEAQMARPRDVSSLYVMGAAGEVPREMTQQVKAMFGRNLVTTYAEIRSLGRPF